MTTVDDAVPVETVAHRPAVPTGSDNRGIAREQTAVATAQLVSGGGNLVYAVVAARLLDADAFAAVTTFLALYLVVHVPAGAVAAAAAQAGVTGLPFRVRRVIAACGTCTAAFLVLGAVPLGRALDLPTGLVLLLAGATLTAPTLGVARGRAYAAGDHRAVARSLLIEPVVRIVVGVPLALGVGAIGAAAGTMVGGWAALAAVRRGRTRVAPRARELSGHDDERTVTPTKSLTTGAVFVLFAVVQNLDLVAANRLFEGPAAAQFAVLSTIGGVVAFATATVPFVLLPQAQRAELAAMRTALGLGAVLGGGAAVLALAAPGELYAIAFGDAYRGVVGLAPRYLVAMAVFGIARIVAARRCSRGEGPLVIAILGIAIVFHATMIAALATTPAGVANATLATCVAALLALQLTPADVADRARSAGAVAWGVVMLTAVGFVLRAVTDRGLWVDEAISVETATMPFSDMLTQLRSVDVHPPLHSIVLWVAVRVFGTSEVAVRLPSAIAGAFLVPVMFATVRTLYDRRTATVAALLATVSPLLVWYAQEARMYSLFMVLAVGSVWAQVVALRSGSLRAWAAFGALSGALIWTQYFTVLLVVVQLAAVAAAVMRALGAHERAVAWRHLRGLAVAIAIIAAVVALLVPYVADQLAAYGSRSSSTLGVPSTAGASAASSDDGVSLYAALANAVWTLLGFHADDTMAQIVAFWPLGMLIVLVLLGRRRQATTTYLAVLAVVPAAILFAVGLQKRDLFEVRYFAASAPLVVMLAARSITAVSPRRATVALATAVAVLIGATALVDQQFNGANPRRYDFEGALGEVRERSRPGDVVVFAPGYLGSVIDYYGAGLETRPLTAVPENPDGGVFVLATFRTMGERAVAANVGAQLARLDATHDVVARIDRPNVRVWELR